MVVFLTLEVALFLTIVSLYVSHIWGYLFFETKNT